MKYINGIYNLSKRCLVRVFTLLLIFTSCSENFLDETPLDFLTPENAYSGPADVEQAIVGLHSTVRVLYARNNNHTCIMTALGTDLAYFGENPAGGTMSDYASQLTATSISPEVWRDAYQIIQRANVLIVGINKTEDAVWESEAQKNAALAEAKFFRAFGYRTLVTLYGNVPLVTEAFNYIKTDFVRAPKAEVYALIEEDLAFAAANLPEPGSEAAPGRITQGAAAHLLSEIYLAQGKFQSAVDASSDVINNYGYTLMKTRFGTKLGNDVFGTGDVYYDLFRMNNHNLTENIEAIWVIQVEPVVIGGYDYASERMYGPAYYRMGNTPDGKKAFLGEYVSGKYTGYSDTLGRPVAWVRPTSYVLYKIWQSDWNNDIRNAEHNIKRNFYFDNPASAYHGQKVDFSLYEAGTRNDINDTCQYIFPYFMKIATPLDHYTDPARSGGGTTHKDLYAIRLAETYLIRAEAYLGLNNTEAAAADINEIRNRAQATPVTPAEVDIDYILDERARELYTEEWRMLTLCRLGLLVERVRIYNDNPLSPGANIQDNNNLWPIPQDQIDLNIDAEITQNPGY